MSSVQDALNVETTENLGFKFLFSKQLIDAFNEDIPFANLSNVSIHPSKNLLSIGSSQTVSVYDLQSVRDESVTALNTYEFTTNVVGVFFVGNKLAAVLEDGSTWVTKLNPFEWENYWNGNTTSKVISSSIFDGEVLLLSDEKVMFKISLSQKESNEQLDSISDCIAFDTLDRKLYALHKNGSISIFDEKLTVTANIEKPSLDEPNEPLTIKTLSNTTVLVAYGEPVDLSEEDVMYDFTAYFVDLNTQTFTPSTDIAPPYSTVKRSPSYYSETIYKLTETLPQLFIVGSSCASEVSISTSKEIYKPDQDAACAILPINSQTDNDTQPVGIALDVFSTGTVHDPCSGVESADNLPILYVLTNLGELYCWALYHHSALQDSSFTIEPTKSEILQSFQLLSGKCEESSVAAIKPDTSSSPFKAANPSESAVKDVSRTSSLFDTTKAFAQGFSLDETKTFDNGSSGLNNPITTSRPDSSSTFGKPAFGQGAFEKSNSSSQNPASSSAFGVPRLGVDSIGTSAAFGKPSFGSNTTDIQSAFGKPGFGSSSAETPSPFGKPMFGPNASETPSPFGKPNFGSNTSDTPSPFGKPSFGPNPTEKSNAFGQTSSSSTNFGTQPTGSSPGFGKPSFGAFNSGINSTEPGISSGASAFGTPAFGTPAFGTPAFGTPAFGTSAFGKEKANVKDTTTRTIEKTAFGTTPFGTKINSSTESPFGKPSFGTSPFSTNSNLKTETGVFNASQSFASPFSAFGKDQKTTDPFSHINTKTEDDKSFDFAKFGKSLSSSNELSSSAAVSDSVASKELSDSTVEEDETDQSSHSESTVDDNSYGSEQNDASDASVTRTAEEENSLSEEDNGQPDQNSDLVSPSSSDDLDSSSETENGSGSEEPNLEREEDDVAEVEEKEESQTAVGNSPVNQREEDASSKSEEVEGDSGIAKMEDSSNSVASFANRIKKAANISTENFSNTLMDRKTSDHKESSPFSGFTDSLSNNKGSTPAFSFANFNRDDSTATPTFSENYSPSKKVSTEDHENKSTSIGRVEQGTEAAIGWDDKKVEESQDSKDELPSLDETTQDTEAPAVIRQKTSSISSSPIPAESSSTKVDKHANTAEKIYVSQQVQATVSSKSTATQCCGSEVKDSAIQAFENEEGYLAEQNVPASQKYFISAARLTNFSTLSVDEVVQAIEKTNAQVLANTQVLRLNIENLGEFINDHSLTTLTRTENTISNIASWKLGEAAAFLEILCSKVEQDRELELSTKKLSQSTSVVPNAEIVVASLKRQFDSLADSIKSVNNPNRKLSWSQLHLSTTVKKKLEEVSSKLDEIKITIQTLKLFNVGNTKETIETVQQLSANGGIGRTDLLSEIQSLRGEISGLKLSIENGNQFETERVLTNGIPSSLPLFETTLELNTKQQLGDFFSSVNL
ncbi:unnamed protein product [Kluyveromyces dobzhanskii CBS 2104]|uniref:WGS project CCBQ000000000 data, contig 00015 n=1 Tax=Kluyveromyces dobzhanskii CBS 2104 TaxID=1427455 RepID=A0A0A8LBD8_9SACH|nr:unnamed protein product [Kluyveromyces dobzhanskii CBS 2104]